MDTLYTDNLLLDICSELHMQRELSSDDYKHLYFSLLEPINEAEMDTDTHVRLYGWKQDG